MQNLLHKLIGTITWGLGAGLFSATAFAAVVYTDSASFEAQLEPGSYLEDFESLPLGDLGVSKSFTGGSPVISYTATVGGGTTLWGNESVFTYTHWLSTSSPSVPLILTFTSGNVTAVGGDFYLTDTGENAISASLTVSLSDGTVQTLASQASGAQPFRAFTTAGPVFITSLTIDPGPAANQFATVDNVRVGVAVPEPAAVGLLFGAGLLGFAALRFQAQKQSKAG